MPRHIDMPEAGDDGTGAPPAPANRDGQAPAGLLMGSWRLVLAMFVVRGHFHTDWWASTFAVFSFYVLSGFLITLIMNRSYRYTARGILAFLVNRALRIYPPYYAAACLSLLTLAFVPGDFVRGVNASLQFPVEFYDIASNLGIFGLYMGQPARLVPPAWALHIELCHYAAIGLVLGRWPALGAAWLLSSMVYSWLGAKTLFETRYFTVLGASLPFAVGSCLHHAGPLLRRLVPGATAARRFLVLAVAIYAVPFVAVWQFEANPMRWTFYANIATTAMLLAALTRLGPVSPRLRRIDRFLGSLSYPVYLFHFPVGIAVLYAFSIQKNTAGAFVATALATAALAVVEARFLSERIERQRSDVKRRLESKQGA